MGALSFFGFYFEFFESTVQRLQSAPYTDGTQVVPFSTSVDRAQKTEPLGITI
jgi:hypothetical protein